MPEISEERLAELEAMEQIVKHIVTPMSRQGAKMMKLEHCWKYPMDLTDDETEAMMGGNAMWDDRPKGWTKKKLVTWSQGYLYGREVVGGNTGQYFERFVHALHDPIKYWRRYRLGLLDMIDGVECEGGECKGVYKIDEERVGLECNGCHTFFSYDQVVEIMRKQGW